MKTLEKFFNDYAVGSTSNDAQYLAGFYAQNFVVAGKDQSSAFSNDENFIEWLKEVSRFNEKSGLQKMAVKNIEVAEIGKYFCKATVTWAAIFAKKPTTEITFDIHYILSQSDNGYKIVLYISDEDQEELMRKNGLQ